MRPLQPCRRLGDMEPADRPFSSTGVAVAEAKLNVRRYRDAMLCSLSFRTQRPSILGDPS